MTPCEHVHYICLSVDSMPGAFRTSVYRKCYTGRSPRDPGFVHLLPCYLFATYVHTTLGVDARARVQGRQLASKWIPMQRRN